MAWCMVQYVHQGKFGWFKSHFIVLRICQGKAGACNWVMWPISCKLLWKQRWANWAPVKILMTAPPLWLTLPTTPPSSAARQIILLYSMHLVRGGKSSLSATSSLVSVRLKDTSKLQNHVAALCANIFLSSKANALFFFFLTQYTFTKHAVLLCYYN